MLMKSGTVTGTGAALNVSLGFKPSYVKILNDTAGDSLEYYDSMADGSAYKRVAAGTGTKITSGGISQYAGASPSTPRGFTLGADGVNAVGVTLRYIATGNGLE